MLSVRTNIASLRAQNALERNSRANNTAATRLSTGYRVNSAMDDAAGLQIATRLSAQSSGMTMAMRNIQNGISLMQVADTVAGSMVDVFNRMQDLAIQAADASTTLADKTALQGEFVALFWHAWDVVATTYNGESLYVDTGAAGSDKLMQPLKFQIGDSSSEVLTGDIRSSLLNTLGVGLAYSNSQLDDVLTAHASDAIDNMSQAINAWAGVRSATGAVANTLEHAYNNLSTMLSNTTAAKGRIMDTDYATESANATSSQMLMQSGTSMLRQANSTAQLTLSLIS
jgi:flagellin